MIAARYLKDAAGIGKFTLLHIFDPGAIYGQGDVVLGLTCHSAGMAADTFAVIDDKAVSHFRGVLG